MKYAGICSNLALRRVSLLSLGVSTRFVVVDDDTYIKVPQFLSALGQHNPRAPVAVGRKFICQTKGALLGYDPLLCRSTPHLGPNARHFRTQTRLCRRRGLGS